MDIFLVYIFDTEFDIDKVTVCKNKVELSDLLVNIDEKYKIIEIQLINTELEEDYKILKRKFR